MSTTKFFNQKIELPPKETHEILLKKILNTKNYGRDLTTEITHQQALLKKVRQSILQDAISGKLTAKWRKENPNVEPASELLARIKAEEEQLIKEGKTAVVTNNISARPATESEILEIEKISLVPFIKNAENKSSGELKKSGEQVQIKEQALDKEIKKKEELKKPKSLAGIKTRYGRVDEITLYSGRVYKGVIISRGKMYKILTTGGTIRVPASKVKRTRVIR